MSIVGKNLLGVDFVQDNKQEWAKINGVCVGESNKYSYITANSNNIGQLLDRMILDQKVVVVVYNTKNGAAYIKNGFDVNDPNDSKKNEDYISFVVKNRVSLDIGVSVPSSTASSGFVKVKNGKFFLDDKEFKFVGPNAYWLGITEEYKYPQKERVLEIFEATKRLSGNSIRAHTLGHSSGSWNSLRPSDNNLNQNAWDAIDYAFSLANQYDIKLIVPLTDCYKWYNGSYGDFCKTRGIPKKDFWTNKEVRADFKDYIFKYLNHFNNYTQKFIKNDTALGIIELGNELGNIREGHDSTNIPTREWLDDISSYVRSIDQNHLILNPADECLGQSDDFNVRNLDCHSGHFYWADYNRMNYGAEQCRNTGKPYIVGEYSSFSDSNWYNEMEKRNINGSLFWSIYPHSNGILGGDKIPHNDGYTIHYSKDNEKHLLLISNHFRKLQNLPQVSSLDFTKSILHKQVTVQKPPIILNPPVLSPQTPVQNIGKLAKLLNNKTPTGAYFQSWSSQWTGSSQNLDLAKVQDVNIIYLSFVNPNTSYKKGQNTFAGTGMDFSSDFNVVKGAIKILQERGILVIISVGGATYPFDTFNSDNISDLCKDLGCNGVDVDWEDPSGNAGSLKFGPILDKMRRSLGNELLMCSAAFSVGAYGEGAFKDSKPPSNHTGMCIPGLKSHGHTLDWINIMSYDASPAFSPIESYDAYRTYYKGPLMIGCEVPPEAWGGNVINLEDVKKFSNYLKSKGPENGIFVWSYQKPGTPNCSDILKTSISVLGNITSPVVIPPTISQPKPVVSIPSSTKQKRCIYYHANWSTYARNYQIKDIPKEVTDISYAFFNLDAKGNVTEGDSWADSEKRFSDGIEPQDSWNSPGVGFYGNFGQIKKIQNSGRKLDVSLSVGGWTWSVNFSPAVSTIETRTNFVNNILNIFKKYTIFSGISIDWEYVSDDGVNYGNPGNLANKQDSDNLALFLVQLREAFKNNGMSKYTIAMCTIADPNKCKFNLEKIHPLLDELHIMTYDFHDGSWGENISRFQCNPRKSEFSNFSCEEAADYYLSRGVESTKLFIGVAFYSRGYSNTEGIGKSAKGGSSDMSWDKGSVDYKNLPLSGATEYNDPISKAAYSYDPIKKVINTYDNPISVIEKCKIIYEKNLGGCIVWESSADYPFDNPRSLMKTLYNNLTNGSPDNVNVPTVTPPVVNVPTVTPPVVNVPTVTPPVVNVPTVTPPVVNVPTVTPPVVNADNWVPDSKQYKLGDLVEYEKSRYICIKPHNSNQNLAPSIFWEKTKVSKPNNIPVVSPVIDNNEWNPNFYNYKVGDIVNYNSIKYRCIQPHASQSHWTPQAVASLWVRS